jgi:hypothetical protein
VDEEDRPGRGRHAVKQAAKQATQDLDWR